MKRLFIHTVTTLLRTAMLFAAILFIATGAKAQTQEEWAAMPDAFETMDPATIIDDGQYYYVQFYQRAHDKCSYLTDCGVNKRARVKDILPYANNRLWTLVAAGDGVETHFKLKSKDGHYISYGSFESGNRFGCVDNFAAATILTFHALDDGYDISEASDEANPMYRPSYNEWADLAKTKKYTNSSSYNLDLFRLRFAKLKSNSAFIIYYRGEGADNDNPNATTTRHYLTYSRTGNAVSATGTLQTSGVSSRTSVYRSDEPLCKLPTLATYHEDGLWTLEPSPYSDEAFYIKKYGTNEYLLNSTDNIGILGANNAVNASYRVEDASVNRYTPIVNYTETPLTSAMFHKWDVDGSGATVTENSPGVAFNVGTQIGQNAMVAGTSTVDHLIYADLSEYSKMVINGTQDMQLRVLMSRQESNKGPWVEKNVTIGSDGKAIVDLTNLALTNGAFATQTTAAAVKMTHVDGTDANVDTSYGEETSVTGGYNNGYTWTGGPGYSISEVSLGNKGWGVNNIIYLQVDASAINGTITKVTLKADASGNKDRESEWGAGYNSSTWSSTMTWNTADRSITDLTAVADRPTVAKNTTQQISLDITGAFTNDPDKVATILVYETRPGGGTFSNPTVEVEYTPSNSGVNINFAHLNAIKTGGGSANGTISSITLLKETGNRYLHYSKGDGWQVEHWTTKHTGELWEAAFLPVEVPEPKDDNFYQVLLKVKKADPTKIKLTRMSSSQGNPEITPLSGSDMDNLYGATFTPNQNYTNLFQIRNLPVGCYESIQITFSGPITEGWGISGIVNGQQNWIELPSNITTYTMNLSGVSTVDDFTIFNTRYPNGTLTITDCRFLPESPSCELQEMLNYDGGTDAYSEQPGVRKLWRLEQDDDYKHFRLKAPNGQYFQGDGKMTADRNSAKVFTNTELLAKFDLKWFYLSAAKETYVNYMVTHRMSYLKQYADDYASLNLGKQGLATKADSDWWDYERGTQKVNHFEITHYVRRDKSITVEFPTILNDASDHIYYQRWYHYNDETCNNSLYPDGSDIEGLKAHVSLDSPGNGNVRYYVYNNGIVTGEKLYWGENVGLQSHANRNFIFTNSDGQNFTVAADVSRYSDFTYRNDASKLDGDLEEPSLTMRYIFYMRDAKQMATNLTACTYGSDKWLETKTFHFPQRQIFYENLKKAGYRGEFIGLRHVFSDYWVFDGGNDDANLVSAVTDNNSGKIEVEISDPNNTGIRLGGYNPNMSATERQGYTDGADADYKGYYLYDMMDNNKISYGDSRFIVFRYPAPGTDGIAKVLDEATGKPVYINVYLNNNGTKYQLAQFTVIFDPGTVTLPYTSVNGSPYVKADGSNPNPTFAERDPKRLIDKAGDPIAKITFDYPSGDTYHYPDKGETMHNRQNRIPPGEVANSSPVPLTFDKTNYAFDGDNCNWGSYAMVTTKNTQFGNNKTALPANDNTYGYGEEGKPALEADEGLQKAFLYIDASEQPGDICSAPFVGDFCAGDKLMFSGWISGSNKAEADYQRCPGGITLTVKGEHRVNGELKTETLYRFCPGQIYELDNGTGNDGSTDATHMVWQQFYFEFTVTEKYDRHWIEVNNNCVSSRGGDFMLDNIAVYAVVPEVEANVNMPMCISVDNDGNTITDMRLLKLSVNHGKLMSSAGINETTGTDITGKVGFVFLDKEKFLTTFRDNLRQFDSAKKLSLGLEEFDFSAITLSELAEAIKEGKLKAIRGSETAYQTAFDAAILGKKLTWHSDRPTENMNASVMYFQWHSDFSKMPTYSFAHAVNKTSPVYGEVVNGEHFVVMNGNYSELNWKTNTDYYIVLSTTLIDNEHGNDVFTVFNLCSECTKDNTFQIEPPLNVLGLDKSSDTGDYVVCEGQVPTLLTDLKGFDLNGNEVPMKNLNYDWWLGNADMLATLENYHTRDNGSGVKLDKALSTLRMYYPDATDLDGIIGHLAVNPNPELTAVMVQFLKELVDEGELVLHQKSISVPAPPVPADDPYFYLVACPIHDAQFDQALNPQGNEYVAFFCDEPQGLRIKVGDKAPTLKTGFVPKENGFESYDYRGAGDAVLSIRLAKKAQFETVQHGEPDAATIDEPTTANAETTHFLWLPIRDAVVEGSGSQRVIRKSDDENIYLASTNDPVWDKAIYTAMNKYDATTHEHTGSLPVVGKIVTLNAISNDAAAQNTQNRLCVYFTNNFEVREGYNYTLSLPFQEDGSNACDGTLLINLKIVPDYEVWTGGAGNTDWNNDENWRRADGNLSTPTAESTDGSKRNNNELLRTNDLPTTSPLKDYVTNYTNYRTAKDRILRKGFAPLYCTHVLIKSNEWGDAPVLYDALDGKGSLLASPFPNLRDQDGWDGTTGETATAATATPILRYDMQARLYDIWSETYGADPNKGRKGDLIAEMYQVNSCDEIALQPTAELLNAHLLNYNSAWMEYELSTDRWYLLGSPLQGTISGEWYAPTGTAQQKTTYYENVTFGEGYDRYSPAIYQRSWDRAKAVLYEIGSTYDTDDDSQTENLGTPLQGAWSNATWDATNADRYLDRLGYKPMSGNKANVAMKGIWSNTYNDATVDYTQGGFSVMVKNTLKNNDQSAGKALIRLPKEDTMYDYYKFSETGVANGGTDTDLADVQRLLSRAKNRGRLKSDLLLPVVDGSVVHNTYQQIQRTEASASRYGDRRTYTRVPTRVGENALPMTLRPFTEIVSAGVSNLGYYLVENPFACGLDMEQFFEANTGLQKKYWLLVSGTNGQPQQQLVQQAESGDWFTQDGTAFTAAKAKVAPGQGFFVQAATVGDGSPVNITFNSAMQAQTRYGEADAGEEFTIVVGTKQKMETIPATYDDDGNPETPEVPLMIDDPNNSGSQIQATIEVPKKNSTTGEYEVEDITDKITVYKYKQQTGDGHEFPLKARATAATRGASEPSAATMPGLVITAERSGRQSSAIVMQREEASNEFLPEEDTELFTTTDQGAVPFVYTLCGRLATTVNAISSLSCLPLGVESTSDAPCTLSFNGVEALGDSVALYDAVEQQLTPLASGMTMSVSGQSHNRYYLVRSLSKQDAAEQTHLQIFAQGLTVTAIASTQEPLVSVRCYDTAGRLVYSATPDDSDHSFTLPAPGVYVVEAQTASDRKSKKLSLTR